MGINLISIKCPDCRATLHLEEERREAFCSYCGSKVLLHNDNEKIYRTIDEAKLKETEIAYRLKLKQLEIEEKKRESREKSKQLKIKISIILGTIGILMMVIGGLLGKASGDSDSGFYMLSLVGMWLLIIVGFIWGWR